MKESEKEKGGAAMTLLAVICVIAVVSVVFTFVIPKQPTIIEYMNENSIKILKTDSCKWCQKQLSEFTTAELLDMEASSLIVECLQKDTWICGEIGTPAWWMDGEIVYQGYIPRDKIISTMERYR